MDDGRRTFRHFTHQWLVCTLHTGNIHVIPIASFMLYHEVHTHIAHWCMCKLNVWARWEQDEHLIGIRVHVFCAFTKFSNSRGDRPTDRCTIFFESLIHLLLVHCVQCTMYTFVHIISTKRKTHTHTNSLFFPLVPAFTCHLIKSARAWIGFFLLAPILYEFNFCAQSFLCRWT